MPASNFEFGLSVANKSVTVRWLRAPGDELTSGCGHFSSRSRSGRHPLNRDGHNDTMAYHIFGGAESDCRGESRRAWQIVPKWNRVGVAVPQHRDSPWFYPSEAVVQSDRHLQTRFKHIVMNPIKILTCTYQNVCLRDVCLL